MNMNCILQLKKLTIHLQRLSLHKQMKHKTIQQEFYAVAFRTKVYNTLEQLQDDLDKWLEHYNFERTHQGKNCKAMTPMECFEKRKHLAKIKMIGYNPLES